MSVISHVSVTRSGFFRGNLSGQTHSCLEWHSIMIIRSVVTGKVSDVVSKAIMVRYGLCTVLVNMEYYPGITEGDHEHL